MVSFDQAIPKASLLSEDKVIQYDQISHRETFVRENITMPGLDFIPILITIFWIWMLIDCITNNKIRGGSKVFWLLAIFFTHIIGAVIYYCMRSTQRNPVTAFTYYYEVISKFFKQSAPPQSQPMPPPQSYADYQHGYQGQPQHYQEQRDQPPIPYGQQEQPLYTPPKAEYEEPLTISYPEMPQQQQ